MKDEIRTLSEDRKELLELRRLILNKKEEQDAESDEKISIPKMKVLIIGGHEQWKDKLKQILPDTFTFLSGINDTFDIRILDNMQSVFLNINYMSHSTYYKLMNHTKKKRIEVFYLNSTNTQIAYRFIASKLVGKAKHDDNLAS